MSAAVAVKCRRCGDGVGAEHPVVGAAKDSGPSAAASRLVCHTCFRCDGCGAWEKAGPAAVLDSGEAACAACAQWVPTCVYCGYATFCGDVVSECTGCGEVACMACAETLAAEDRACACEKV